MEADRSARGAAAGRSSSRSRRAARLTRLGVVAAVLVLSAGVAASCWAFFTTTGVGQGSGAVGTMNAPTSVTATQPNPNVRTVHVTWVIPTTPDNSTPSGFTVSRFDGTTTSAACGTGTTPLPGTTTNCDDTNVPSGSYTYTVTMRWASWTSTSAPSASVTIAASSLDHFTVSPSPTTPTAGTSFTATVTAIDQYGATLTSYSGTKTVAWSGLSTSPAPASRAPSYPTTSVVFTNGASTTTLTATAYAAGANTLTMTESTKSGSASLTVGVAALDHFAVSPSTTTPTAGTSFTATVAAHDLYDNAVTSYSGTKTVAWSALSTSPAPASQAPQYPTTSVAFTNGASTTTLTATAYAAGANTLTMTESTKSGSASFTVGTATLDHFILGPSTTTPTAGTSFTTTVAAHDLYDNAVTSYSGTKTVAWSGLSTSPAPASRAPSYPTTSVAFTNGASTTTLTATAYAAGANSLTMTESGKSGSVSLTVGFAAASQLSAPTPTTRTAGGAFNLTVAAHDAYDNTVTSYTGNKTLNWSGPGNAPNGTPPSYPANPVNFSAGAATVSITLYKAETPTITVGDGTLSGATGSFTVSPGAANKLAFTAQPSNTTSTNTITPSPAVTVQDAYSNVVTSDSSSVTVAIGTNPNSGTLSGTTTVAASSGVATFGGLSIDKAGTGYTLVATDGSLTSATSSTFNIAVGPATQLVFTQQPSGSTGTGTAFPIQPWVAAQDAGGNTVTSYNTSITLAMANNPGNATLTCTSLTVTPVNGVAQFANCKLSKTGVGFTMTATSGTLGSATSNAFNMTTAATKVIFTTQPGGGANGTAWTQQPVVSVEDNSNRVVTAYPASSLSLAINTGTSGAVLTCAANPVTTSYGVATFAGCSIDTIGASYTLTATVAALTVNSSSFVVSGPATKLVFTQVPASGTLAGSPFASQPAVTVEDASGNAVANYTTPVTLAITSGTGQAGAVLSCTTNPLTPSSGIAAFSGCAIDRWGTGYTLTAMSGSLTAGVSTSFDVYSFTPNLQLLNKAGGTAGKAEQGDTIVITYPDPISMSTFCTGWSSGSLTHVTVSFNNGTPDIITGMTDTADCASGTGFNSTGGTGLGSINLGANNYFNASGSFTNGSASWNSGTNTLTITLGALASGTPATGGNATATYTPDASLSVPASATMATAPPAAKRF